MWEEAQAVLEFQVEGGAGGGGSKKRAFRREGVDFFLTNAVINQWYLGSRSLPLSRRRSFSLLGLWDCDLALPLWQKKNNNKHLPRKKYTFRRKQTGLWAYSFSYNSKMRRHVWVMFHQVLVESSKLPFIVFSVNFKQGKPVRLNMNDHMMRKLRIE